jgi:hypothetical protein
MVRVKTPDRIDFPHNLGIEERASLVLYGQLIAEDPAAASYESVAIARGKATSTIKNQLDSARRKMGTNTTWGAYLLMMAREKVQSSREEKQWEAKTLREKPGAHSSKLVRTGKGGTRRVSEPVQAAS